ncbi:MAG: ABC transporter substrate-binding protein [Ramlibacter sp.]
MKPTSLLAALGLCVFTIIASPAQAAEIVVGQVAPLTGRDASQGRAYAAGMKLAFEAANRAAGSGGNTFTLLVRDDAGRPEQTVRLTRELLAGSAPLVLAGYVGGRGLDGLLTAGLLEKEQIALVGFRDGEVRPEIPWLYNVRARLGDEVNKIAEHLATLGMTRLALLHEDGPAVAALVSATEEAARHAKILLVARAAYPEGTTRVSDAVDALVKAEPQAILVVASGAAAARFIEQYRSAGGAAQVFVHAGADMEQVAKQIAQERSAFVSSVMQGVAIAQVMPNPYRISSPLIKDFHEQLARAPKLGEPVSYVMLEGYINARVIVEAVRRQGARPTREGLAAALERMDGFNLGGFVVSFRPGTHSGSRFVELSIISSTGKIRE